MRVRALACTALGLGLCAGALAQDAPEADGLTPEAARHSVRVTTEWLARSIDGWFGSQPFEQGGAVSDGRLDLSLYKRQGQRAGVGLRFNAKLRLPNAQKYAYLFIGRDDRRDVAADTPSDLSHQQQLLRESEADNTFVAGLGVSLARMVDLRLGLRGGLKPYAQARVGAAGSAGAFSAAWRETLFWDRADRVGATTVLSAAYELAPELSLRWLSSVTLTQRQPQPDWSTSLGAYRDFGALRLLTVEALADGVRGRGVGVADYGLQLKWQQPIHRDWLLLEGLGGLFRPKVDAQTPRGRAWALGCTLKLRF